MGELDESVIIWKAMTAVLRLIFTVIPEVEYASKLVKSISHIWALFDTFAQILTDLRS